MDEAFAIVKYISERTGRYIHIKDASYLASFSFPLERKLAVIQRVIDFGRAENIYSALYFRIAFVEAETAFHKNAALKKDASFSSASDIISRTV